MREKDLKNILNQGFQFETWKELLPLFFNKIDYFNSPQNVFTENHKVINGQQVGIVGLDDNKQLAIFTVEVANNVSIVRNRQGLREIAAKYIDQNIIHGALTFFYNKNQADYRFSFIAKESSIDEDTGELIRTETKPKRYTYLLGANETCTTSAKRLMVLADKKENETVNIKQLKEAFSVEALNKDFFKTYKYHYEKFWRFLANEQLPYRNLLIDNDKEEKEEQEKPIRDYVKKLLGRIVFLHFLQKKGWLGCPANRNDWKNGEARFIKLLFEGFLKKENFNGECLNILFFKTLNTKRENDLFQIDGLDGIINGSRIPYLNGGLFEPDEVESSCTIDFPIDYFQELFDFFEQYNFTIDENSPDDHEIGIDPEMLGHIFENLLEENKERGAFYTPKEIVQYMCKESLIQYLLNTFQEKDDIDQFINVHHVSAFLSDKENAILLDGKLDVVKVCDPAIGSGAFPIGMLQEIFEAKRFIYPYLKTTKPFDPASIKKNIIQNSIYGVDIEKGAVDIAQLRFWLALVVEEETPHPLPNLDYKIMQGNSLLEEFGGIDLSLVGDKKNDTINEPERDLFGNIKESQMSLTFSKADTAEKIQSLIKEYFSIEESSTKNNIRSSINTAILNHIKYNIELREQQLQRWIRETGNPDKLSKSNRRKYDNWLQDINQLQTTRSQLIKTQQTDERPYFLWRLYFLDVFKQGGFDIIIGNPPYIQLQKGGGKLAKLYENCNFQTYEKTGDIYSLFYEKGYNMLKPHGHLIFITNKTWMRTSYGQSTRTFFSNETNPILLVDFSGEKIFESATVNTNILLLSKDRNQGKTVACIVKEKVLNKLSVFVRQHGNIHNFSNAQNWGILSPIEKRIKDKIDQIGLPLKEWDFQINYGIKTGFNDAFIINGEKRRELIDIDSKSEEIIRPILRGRDIKRYGYEYQDLWLIATFPSLKIDIENYQAVKQHLLSFGYDRLKQTGGENARKKTNNQWFETQDSISYWEDFNKQKLIWLCISDKAVFSVDEEGMLCNNAAYFISTEYSKYLCCVMNSRIIEWYFDKICTTTGVGTNKWEKFVVEMIPIPKITISQQKPFEELIEKLSRAKTIKSAQIGNIEKEISKLVATLYNLTDEETIVLNL